MSAIPEANFPAQTRALFTALESKFRIFGYPNTRVTIEEVEPEADSDH